jgi:hypothetical protein
MVSLGALWLPIIVSAVFVFFASFLLWAVLPFHKGDYRGLPNEAGILEVLRNQGIPAGQYMFPFCRDHKEAKTPEMTKKIEQGPVGFMVIRPSGKISMSLPMIQSVAYNLIVAVFVAYLAGVTLSAGAPYLRVFRVVGTAGILAYCGALFYQAIWFWRPWKAVWKEVVDGVIYGLLTAGVFGWLWPR